MFAHFISSFPTWQKDTVIKIVSYCMAINLLSLKIFRSNLCDLMTQSRNKGWEHSNAYPGFDGSCKCGAGQVKQRCYKNKRTRNAFTMFDTYYDMRCHC